MPTSPRDPIAAKYANYVLGGLVEQLLYEVTGGECLDSAEIALEFSEQIGHTTMVEALHIVRDAMLEIAPETARAQHAANLADGLQRQLRASRSRPIMLDATTVLVNGRRLETPNARLAIAWYDLCYPWRDIVQTVLPAAPPDLSTNDKIYEFIGMHVADTIIGARGALLREAVRVCTSSPCS